MAQHHVRKYRPARRMSMPPLELAQARKRLRRLRRQSPQELGLSAEEHRAQLEAASATVIELRVDAQGYNAGKQKGRATKIKKDKGGDGDEGDSSKEEQAV